MRKRTLLGLLLPLVLPVLAGASEGWSPDAQVRHRFEYDNKDFDSSVKPVTFSLLRTRLSADFEAADNVRAFVQIQDSRTFGEETNTLTDGSADRLDLHQGYLSVADFFDTRLGLKLGRYEVVYGPQRLIGAVGWHNIGRSFDGATARYGFEKGWIDLFSFAEAESLRAGDIGDAYIHGLWANWMPAEPHSVQPFWIWQRKSPSKMLSRHTLGVYLQGKRRIHHEVEVAFQTGEITTPDTTADVAAFMAALNVGVRFPDAPAKPDVSVGVDYLSGDDGANPTEYKVFDTLYATNHKYYGFMDYFLNIPANTFGLGLVDAHVRLSAQPHTRLVTNLAIHVFRAAEEYTLVGGSTSKAFGTEGDLTLKLKYNKNLGFVMGASVFAPGDIFEEKKGSDTSSWFYLMTTFNS